MKRTLAFLSATTVTLLTLGAALTSGCSTDLCEYVQCVSGAGGAGGATSSSTTTMMSGPTTTSAASMTTTGATMPGCELKDGMPVSDTCGVFVKAGATGGNGSQAMPFGSVTEALTANPVGIYICGSDVFDETIALGKTSLFGGLTCDTWTYGANNIHPTLRGPADAPVVTTISTESRVIDSVDIEARDAVSEGASSIAILASDGALMISRSKITAKSGAKGKAGVDGGPQGAQAKSGSIGGNACGAVSPTPGGAEASQTCGAMSGASVGGLGGSATNTQGGDGFPGSFGGLGAKGLGEQAVGWSCGANGNGGAGADGSPGMVGLSGTDKGSLDSTGFTPSKAGDGGAGVHGQGGGGGGGAKGPADCNTSMAGNQPGPGASGGSGGAGGCGGLPGTGGTGGGSSFGILSLNVLLSFGTNVTIAAGAGGEGGDGGLPQSGAFGGPGALGGFGSNGSKSGCQGGSGGQGGNGGGGGGGRGGHSAGVVFIGTAPAVGATYGGPPPQALGGVGQGNGAVGGNSGMPGTSCRVFNFEGGSCPVP